jgi:hypothetical protein
MVLQTFAEGAKMILKLSVDNSALEKQLNVIKTNPYAIEIVRQMLPVRFKELFATRSELNVEADSLVIYLEPTQLLKALSSAVLN